MSRAVRPYARFYYDDFIREYPAIYADDAAFAAWMRLLTLAEKLWPIAPEMPRHVKPGALRKLVDAGLVKVGGMTYRVRGLDAERSRRHHLAKSAADSRWSADGNADAYAEAMPRRDETRQDPQTPTSGGRRSNGTNHRAVAAKEATRAAEAERERKARRNARYLAQQAGRITPAQRADMDERDAPLDEIPTERGAAYQGVPA